MRSNCSRRPNVNWQSCKGLLVLKHQTASTEVETPIKFQQGLLNQRHKNWRILEGNVPIALYFGESSSRRIELCLCII